MPRHDISYDFEDFAMTAEELQVKYPEEHPEYTLAQWRGRPVGEEQSHSYWQWVVAQIRKDDGAMPSTLEEAGIVPVQDLDQFVRILADWHASKTKQLRHLLQVPAGTTVEIDGVDHVLAGDLRDGFIAGITVALSLVGELPFVAEVEDAPAQPDSGDAS